MAESRRALGAREEKHERQCTHFSTPMSSSQCNNQESITDRYERNKKKKKKRKKSRPETVRETSHEAVSYAQSRCVCAFRKPACLAWHALLHSVHPVHSGCPSKSWSGSGCAQAHTEHLHVPVATYWAAKTHTLVAKGPTRARLATRETTTLSAEDNAHTGIPSARGTEMNAIEKNNGRARERED